MACLSGKDSSLNLRPWGFVQTKMNQGMCNNLGLVMVKFKYLFSKLNPLNGVNKKSHIRDTLNLLTNADSSTYTKN